jgi:hypothetical protein
MKRQMEKYKGKIDERKKIGEGTNQEAVQISKR